MVSSLSVRSRRWVPLFLLVAGSLWCSTAERAHAAELRLDESPAVEGEWGYRPQPEESVSLNPPRFSWRPQKGAEAYTVQASRDATFASVDYEARVEFNVHAPPKPFPAGTWAWRFRYQDAKGNASNWSTARPFTIAPHAREFPLPARDELLARIPASHPRLFVRPEQMDALRAKAKGELKPLYDRMTRAADAALMKPTPTDEPPKYPKDIVLRSEAWRKLWWGAREQTIRTLEPAARLGFAYQLSGDTRYADEAKRILLAAAKWDPKGSSGYRYNDEAGMPYNYLFARTYTFIHATLTEGERKTCRDLMALRGREMFEHLCPGHFWKPYNSHKNRAWHKLGEVGIAFKDEIPEAADWVWFATNVFANTYPVWNDADGGWHEGLAYWRSYMGRFTWWADVMYEAMGIDAYQLPFFSQVGYYPMYLQPPGSTWGGFGDLTQNLESRNNVPLVGVFAAQAQNPHWQWYVEAHRTKPADEGAAADGGFADAGYIGFTRAARYGKVAAKAPTDLPSSRLFRGTGQAYLNSNLLDGTDNVAVLFKSSPFGSQSHGYNGQNAFELYVGGKPVLLSTGKRDVYGSDHHANWMWETKSDNNITVGGRGQMKHTATSHGRVTTFHTSAGIDYVQGDAAGAYDPPLKRYTRSILFIKPEIVVIFDRLETDKPETFTMHLHAPEAMKIADQRDVRATNGDVSCDVALLAPQSLAIEHTDKFDAPPRERVKLTQYHLTARTPSPSAKEHFVTVLRPRKAGASTDEGKLDLQPTDGGYLLTADVGGKQVKVKLDLDAPTGEPDMRATVTSAGRAEEWPATNPPTPR
jgi:hypothetical protein